jgi:uncharacterized protein (TIGR02588 family)
MARETEHRRGHEESERRNPLETVVLTVSALLVAGSIAVLVWQGTREERPPELVLHVDSIVARGAAHHVHVTVRNDGDATAAAVQLRARLLRDTAVVAESEAVIDWVPGRSAAQATLLFAEDPRAFDVEAGVVGFAEP